MEHETSRLVDLIEQGEFETLTEVDQAFVLLHMSMEEFSLQRALILATSELKFNTPVPNPLVLPNSKRSIFNSTIRIYQSLFVAACAVIACLIFYPKTQLHSSSKQHPSTVVAYVHDTLVQTIPSVKIVEHIIVDTFFVIQSVKTFETPDRQLITSVIQYPSLVKSNLANTGSALAGDITVQLLPKMTPLGN